jgi:hypothetical protein
MKQSPAGKHSQLAYGYRARWLRGVPDALDSITRLIAGGLRFVTLIQCVDRPAL